eukprot:1394997-Amorphochlora_amoeboformis.AAC.1
MEGERDVKRVREESARELRGREERWGEEKGGRGEGEKAEKMERAYGEIFRREREGEKREK